MPCMERLQIAEELGWIVLHSRVMTTCQRQGTWTLQVGPLGIVHQKPLTSIMRNSHSLHCLVEMSPFEAVVPGKTRRPGPVPTNNETIKHKNKGWKINPRKQLSESGQDYAGDAFLCIALHLSIFHSIYLTSCLSNLQYKNIAINDQSTKIVINPGSQLSVISVSNVR